jgi:hypothetical protein
VQDYSIAAFGRDLERQLNRLGIRLKVHDSGERGTVVETWRLDQRYTRMTFEVPTRRLTPLTAAVVARTIRTYYARGHRGRH